MALAGGEAYLPVMGAFLLGEHPERIAAFVGTSLPVPEYDVHAYLSSDFMQSEAGDAYRRWRVEDGHGGEMLGHVTERSLSAALDKSGKHISPQLRGQILALRRHHAALCLDIPEAIQPDEEPEGKRPKRGAAVDGDDEARKLAASNAQHGRQLAAARRLRAAQFDAAVAAAADARWELMCVLLPVFNGAAGLCNALRLELPAAAMERLSRASAQLLRRRALAAAVAHIAASGPTASPASPGEPATPQPATPPQRRAAPRRRVTAVRGGARAGSPAASKAAALAARKAAAAGAIDAALEAPDRHTYGSLRRAIGEAAAEILLEGTSTLHPAVFYPAKTPAADIPKTGEPAASPVPEAAAAADVGTPPPAWPSGGGVESAGPGSSPSTPVASPPPAELPAGGVRASGRVRKPSPQLARHLAYRAEELGSGAGKAPGAAAAAAAATAGWRTSGSGSDGGGKSPLGVARGGVAKAEPAKVRSKRIAARVSAAAEAEAAAAAAAAAEAEAAAAAAAAVAAAEAEAAEAAAVAHAAAVKKARATGLKRVSSVASLEAAGALLGMALVGPGLTGRGRSSSKRERSAPVRAPPQ
ncbi:hypothetical protein Rsub_06568 [Raphidocelis subcapitata]|uniref:Uncharacterized protein n=1 Tax=Raphidocelis subcapitata TaxID=307507 RepID=A0A2V0P8M5_9CHLO|nr:hypothetical protein Rsub_06568 [Raphidocelis subcapitata]|eukprot:GBF93435.1 hypothetical protein Rsub_06568 [Raphidocelis subcapitata]